MRAEKRIVNAKKELVKLKQIAAKLQGNNNTKFTKEELEKNIPDIHVNEDLDSVMQVETNRNLDDDDDQSMTSSNGDDNGPSRISKKEMLRVNPQWMNQRKIKSIKSKIKKHNRKKARRGGSSAGLSSRKAKKSIGRGK